MDPIPPPIQRATALMNPTQRIRTQDSPAYFPPPELAEQGAVQPEYQQYGGMQQGQQQQQARNPEGDVVRNLEKASAYWG